MKPSHRIILVIGAARSGKSEWAERLAEQSDRPVIYVATSQLDPADLEWKARIDKHRRRRPDHWKTQEVPINLVSYLAEISPPTCLLIDSLGTWVANLLEEDDLTWENIVINLLEVLEQVQIDIIFVAEETGWGVIPSYKSGRLFRDRLGSLTRQIGAIADTVYLVTGGYVLNLSELGQPLR